MAGTQCVGLVSVDWRGEAEKAGVRVVLQENREAEKESFMNDEVQASA